MFMKLSMRCARLVATGTAHKGGVIQRGMQPIAAPNAPVLVACRSYMSTNIVRNGKLLMKAVASRDHKAVSEYLGSGVDPNFRGEQNVTALMIAAENNMVGAVSELLKKGADPNLQDDLGETALMKASRDSHKDVVHILVQHGAQADILNYENMTAREATLDVEVDEMLSKTQGDAVTVTAEEHVTLNMHSKKHTHPTAEVKP